MSGYSICTICEGYGEKWIGGYEREGDVLGSRPQETTMIQGLITLKDPRKGWELVGQINAAIQEDPIDLKAIPPMYTSNIRYYRDKGRHDSKWTQVIPNDDGKDEILSIHSTKYTKYSASKLNEDPIQENTTQTPLSVFTHPFIHYPVQFTPS